MNQGIMISIPPSSWFDGGSDGDVVGVSVRVFDGAADGASVVVAIAVRLHSNLATGRTVVPSLLKKAPVAGTLNAVPDTSNMEIGR